MEFGFRIEQPAVTEAAERKIEVKATCSSRNSLNPYSNTKSKTVHKP